jgi:hypothetical protein
MGKYEIKVTRTHHLMKIIVAILISFVVGLGTGYFLGQKVRTTAAVQTISQKAQPSQNIKANTYDEQAKIVKDVLNSFYNINISTFNSLENESKKESQAQGVSKDSIFRDKLIKQYQGILAKKQLTTITDFVNKGNIQSGYFLDYFKSQEGTVINTIENIDYKSNIINAKAVVSNPFEYGGIYDIPSSASFFGELKGKGVTKAQYSKLLGLKPSKMHAIEVKNIILTVENINGKWMITSMNDELVSSEIKDVILSGKVITFADLMKKFIK